MLNHRERVKCAHVYHVLFRDLHPDNAHSTFFLCACIGYFQKLRIPIGKSYDSFWSDTMPDNEFNAYILMMLESNDMDPNLLKEDKKEDNAKAILELAQEYANGGMKFLLDEVIADHVAVDSNGVYGFVREGMELLPKTILCWLSENIDHADEPIDVEVVPQL